MNATAHTIRPTTTVEQSHADAIRRFRCRPPAASVEPLLVLNADNEGWTRLELIVSINDRHDLRGHADRFVNAGGDATGRGPRVTTTCAELIRLQDDVLILRLIQRRYGVGTGRVTDLADLYFRVPAAPMRFYRQKRSDSRYPGQFPPTGLLIAVETEEIVNADTPEMLVNAISVAHECSVYISGSPIFISGIYYRGEVWRLKNKPPPVLPSPFC